MGEPTFDGAALDALTAAIDAAEKEVFRLCAGPNRPGGRSFRMTVPVEKTDSDIVLIDGLDAGRKAIAALRGVVDRLQRA